VTVEAQEVDGQAAQPTRVAGPALRSLVMRYTTSMVFLPSLVTARRSCATWAALSNSIHPGASATLMVRRARRPRSVLTTGTARNFHRSAGTLPPPEDTSGHHLSLRHRRSQPQFTTLPCPWPVGQALGDPPLPERCSWAEPSSAVVDKHLPLGRSSSKSQPGGLAGILLNPGNTLSLPTWQDRQGEG
jgi:hypothetical protein